MNIPTAKPYRMKLITWLLIGLGGSLLLGGFLLMFMVATGSVEGEEFSPEDFTRRRFAYVRPDWFPITLVGIEYKDVTDPFVTTLISQGLLVPKGTANQRWDLVSDNRMPRDSTAYDAKILCRYLDLRMLSGDLVLEDWTTKHPEHAKVFWPAVARLAQAGEYPRISQIMDLVVSSNPVALEEFQAQVAQILATGSL